MDSIFTDFIRPELLILIPVLILIGKWLKGTKSFDDRHIPLMLGLISIILCIIETVSVSDIVDFRSALGAIFTAVTQGLICAGCSVYAHQIAKQYSNDKPTDLSDDK